ncbi:hypothetical protein GCM10009730_14980 [Streptomyces albidochromogenes]
MVFMVHLRVLAVHVPSDIPEGETDLPFLTPLYERPAPRAPVRAAAPAVRTGPGPRGVEPARVGR